MTPPDVKSVQTFWEAHPLFGFENPYPSGSREFFAWHHQVRTTDVEPFAMRLYEFNNHAGEKVLDVGCGIGWLCHQFAVGGAVVTGVDITFKGVSLTQQRLALYNLEGNCVQASAEALPFASQTYDFVTCAGVLHHTPDTERGIQEIYRVLRPGGRAMISLYYKSWALSDRLWPVTRFFIRRLFGRIPGRDAFRQVQTPDDLVRMYDGNENPIGKAYSHAEMKKLLQDFLIEDMEIHYFPKRFLPFGKYLPRFLHRLFDRYLGLMIYARVRKK